MEIIKTYIEKSKNTEELKGKFPKKELKQLSDIVIEINNGESYIIPKRYSTDLDDFSCSECCLFHTDYDCASLCTELEKKLIKSDTHIGLIKFQNISKYEMLFLKNKEKF